MKNLANDYKEMVLKPGCAFVKKHPIATIVYASVCGLTCVIGSLAPVIMDKIEEIKIEKEMEKDLKGYLSKD